MGKHTGKKRWRKNDIKDIEAAIASSNVLKEHLGTSVDKLHTLPSDSLFLIDKDHKDKPKNRTKEFYKNKVLSYQRELEPSHIVPPKTVHSETDQSGRNKKVKQKLERTIDRIEKKQELVAKQSKKKNAAPKLYDIWGTAPEPRKEIVARPYPQKIVRRKPSELPAIEVPTTDISYNPSDTAIATVNDALKKAEEKFKTQSEKLDRLIKPRRARTLEEIQKTTRPLTSRQLLKLRKTIKKDTRRTSKASKPGKKADDPNFSIKFTRTQRNKLLKKKLRRKLEHKARSDARRSKDLDNVEKIVQELDERASRSKEVLLKRKLREKLQIGRTKRLIRHKFLALPKTSTAITSASSLRSFKPPVNLVHEKVVRFQQRNILAE